MSAFASHTFFLAGFLILFGIILVENTLFIMNLKKNLIELIRNVLTISIAHFI